MGILLAIIFAKAGSRRIIGGYDSFFLCLLLSFVGIMIIYNSRRLDDEEADKALIEKFKPLTA